MVAMAGLMGRMLNFDLETETEGNSALVRIRGDLDLQVVERVTDALTQIESGEPELLVAHPPELFHLARHHRTIL